MINIEIDGIPLQVDPSKMIIQAADEAGIDIPRFCYHKKLSIAANCRMCLVEVEKSGKALPACATPVSEGMKVFTDSAKAKAAQRGVMEFLLINHPLDCPICDQGGECELQDLSMGYGAGVGRFSESKRVVKDKDIGALVKTDMTRCIHCTRCVRFGQEIAGIKELGATGRGEHMEIGTYIEQSLASELSGNIIDLCPVGALTSKPFRYTARAWELSAHPSVACHDTVGSNIEVHVRRDQVMRVVPRENSDLNETWLSDRDRFSYLGLDHEQRATSPMVKRNGQWQKVDWQTAMNVAIDGLKSVIDTSGVEQVAGVLSPTATLEESYLFQKLLRGLGVENIDHRLRQQDFSNEGSALQADYALSDLDTSDSVLVVGSRLRSEQPILAHRLRQAALNGTRVNEINFFVSELLMPVDTQLAVDSTQLFNHLAGIAKALISLDSDVDASWVSLLDKVVPVAADQTIAMQLANADKATILVGDLVNSHPDAAKIKSLLALIAQLTASQLVILPQANAKAAQLAGAYPNQSEVLNIQQAWQQQLNGYVLFGLEAEADCINNHAALAALEQAGCVVSLQTYVTEQMLAYSDVILPVTPFTETSGTFVSLDGQWQSFRGVVSPKGDSRPGWKVLRVLANLADLEGFDYVSSQAVCDEIKQNESAVANSAEAIAPDSLSDASTGLELVMEVPMFRTDGIVRRSVALQEAMPSEQLLVARMHSAEAEKQGIETAKRVELQQGEQSLTVDLVIDDTVAEGCVLFPAGLHDFGESFAPLVVKEAIS